MNHVTLASTAADAAAVEQMVQHHAQLTGALAGRVSALVAAVDRGAGVDEARTELARWCDTELVPHALAEEKALYPAGLGLESARLLVEAMLAEHLVIVGLVDQLHTESSPVAAAALGKALGVLLETHVAKENERLLPVLAAAPDVSVAELLGAMRELIGGAGHAERRGVPDHGGQAGGRGHACACGEEEQAGLPELDVCNVPHAIRHATVFGALDAVGSAAGLVLIAPHDPLPLLAQIEQRAPGTFEVSYLERGPEAWRLQLLRHG